MTKYYVNNRAQTNGDHEVHKQECSWLALAASTTYLGEHSACYTAVARARTIYRQSNGCKYCSPSCHTS
ncbi:hypothetical protein [Sphingobacterium nematocida]|uniref:hypothetical protein n=1 Tax=Sphingobacterium nematocida TaxID=1513896 RepID=UPI0009A6AE04|nr:hypothetical protein [Sphingobacterium nematocida]